MRKTIVAAVGLASLLAAGTEARAEGPRGLGHKPIFEMYCGGCHGLNGSPGRAGVPDLSAIGAKYGAPLPTGRLVDFVLNERSIGNARICGERATGWIPGAPFNDYLERATVRAALSYLDAATGASERTPPSPASSPELTSQ